MKVYVDKDKLESHDIKSVTALDGKEFQQVRMYFLDVEKVEVKNINEHDKKLKLEICENIQKELKQNVRNVQVLLDPLEKEDYAVLTGVIRGYRNSLYIVEKLKKQILEK